MNRAFLIVAALGAASIAGAQTPPTPTSAASGAPQAAGPAKPKAGGGEIRIGGFMVSGDRSVEFGNSVSNETGSIQGIDVVMRTRVIGLQVKSLTGDFGTLNHVTSADVRLLLFPPAFTVMAGGGRRALWGSLNEDSPTLFTVGMVGLSSTVAIGGSGLRTNLSVAMYMPGPAASAGSTSQKTAEMDKGMEGEASLLYKFPKLPLFVQAGYRTEVFTQKNSTGLTPEEVRGVKVGAGLLLGGR